MHIPHSLVMSDVMVCSTDMMACITLLGTGCFMKCQMSQHRPFDDSRLSFLYKLVLINV